MSRKLTFVGAVMWFSCITILHAGVAYSFATLDFPGGSATQALGINNGGQIVGRYSGGLGVGFVYAAGGYTSINVPGSSFTFANGINDNLQIVGNFCCAPGEVGFLYSGGSFTTITAMVTATEALGINNHGQIMGAYSGGGTDLHGFVENGGVMTTINFPGADQTSANGINGGGDIVGSLFFLGGSEGRAS